MKAAILAGLLMTGIAYAQAGGDAAERAQINAIVQWTDAHDAEGMALLERAVNMNSGTGNHAGVRAVGALFQIGRAHV